nr:DNA polymerase III subunit epsilon [Acinetobacter sp.]
MSEITLYVDGACRGNPGLGGWGAYIITESEEHKLCGGEPESTNNRMELTAAIEGIAFCPMDAKLIVWTDSIYVKRGITEWIQGWKKKNWKDVKNPDLWKKLDATCQGRNIEWNWIKGHAGHPGNEMADQLANLGADQTLEKIKNGEFSTASTQETAKPLEQVTDNKMDNNKKIESDWLLDDPFGFDLAEEGFDEVEPDNLSMHHHMNPSSNQDAFDQEQSKESNASSMMSNTQTDSTAHDVLDADPSIATENATVNMTKQHPHIVITPAKLNLQGPRQLILDTETTGFYYQDTDRIIEVGAIEMINRKLTGSSIHIYINPKKPVGDSENVHGISDEFLKDKPVYAEIADVLFDYLKGAEIIAHNASFDMNFLDMEFKRAGFVALSDVCEVTDTLAMAKSKHPGQKNSLDALVRRYEIVQRDRTFHGALLDAEILADVYLAMTGGQVSFDMDSANVHQDFASQSIQRAKIEFDLPVIMASDDELEQHENWVKQYQEKHGEPCFFGK